MTQQPNRREHGASLVEFALISPVLFLLLIGTVTGGLTLSRQNSVKNAVRETTRLGAVLPDFSATDSNLTALYLQAKNAATGDLDPDAPGRVICVAQIDEGDKWYLRIYEGSDTPSASSVTGIVAASLDPEMREKCDTASAGAVGSGTNRVWVRAVRSSDIEALLFQQTVTLQAKALTRHER